MPVPPDVFEKDVVTVTALIEGDYVRVLHNVAGVLISKKITIADFTPGFIEQRGANLEWVSASSYRVTPGKAVVYDGTKNVMLSWAANITRSSLSFSANTLQYVYLYSNSGVAALEESTTVPVWDTTLNTWVKTGNTSRRCIGYLQITAAAGIREFNAFVRGRELEVWYTDGENPITSKRPVNGVASTGAWTSFSLATLIPVNASHWWCIPKLSFVTANDDMTLSLSPVDMGSSAANFGPYQTRDRGAASGIATFVGGAWLPLTTAQTYYYRTLNHGGTTGLAIIECQGARMFR